MFPTIYSMQYVQLDIEFAMYFVVLSVLIASIAAFAAIGLNARIGQYSFIQGNIWVVLASLALSLGIWSMHFIGMSAIHIQDNMKINYILTILSILPTVVILYLCFVLINKERAKFRDYILASILMGTAIAVMHYMGVSSMTFEHVKYEYNYVMVTGSLLAAVVLSAVALSILIHYKKHKNFIGVQTVVALLLGVAISSTHYLGLEAMTFYKETAFMDTHGQTPHNMKTMNLIVTISVFVIIMLIFGASVIDRYTSHRLKILDALTRIPNRHAFMNAIHSEKQAHSLAMVSFANLEMATGQYDFVVDDLVVEKIATALKGNLPSMTTVYRLKEHTFVIAAMDQQATIELLQVLEKKMKRFSKGFSVGKDHIIMPAVCSVAVGDSLMLLKDLHANVMLVEQHPGTSYDFSIIHYNARYHTRQFTEQLLLDLQKSLERRELYLMYQPKIFPRHKTVDSVEALIRWEHSTYGFLSPGVFIPVLEAHNRINEVTDWVIEEVCKQLHQWKNQQHMPTKVSINIPGPYLTTNRLKIHLLNMVAKYELQPEQIELEITETSFVKSIEEARKAVDYYRTTGFDVALDDFGIGVSSLAYLKDFRFTTLKIDKSFVDHIPSSPKDCSIMQSIISLGKSLNMKVVAEGIEKKEQVRFLLATNREILIQGYYYAKPLKSQDLAVWLNQEKFDYDQQNFISHG